MLLPASSHQIRLWQSEQRALAAGVTPTFHLMPLVAELAGPLDERALADSLAGLFTTHLSLRTRLLVREGELYQEASEDACPGLVVSKYAGEHFSLEALTDLALAECRRPMQLLAAPLARATLIRAGDKLAALVLVLHHAVADRRTLSLLARDLTARYQERLRGGTPARPAPHLQYGDFSEWQRRLPEEAVEPLLFYWRSRLQDRLGAYAAPRPVSVEYRAAVERFALSPEQAGGVWELARRSEVAPAVVLFTAWTVLLSRYALRPDLVVAILAANRTQSHTEEIAGPLANLLAIPADLDPAAPAARLLAEFDRVWKDAHAHAALPFERVVAALGGDPEIPIAFSFEVEDEQPAAAVAGDLSFRFHEMNLGTGRHQLRLLFQRRGDALAGILTYDEAAIAAGVARRMIDRLGILLSCLTHEPSQPTGRLRMLPVAAETAMLAAWTGAAEPYPHDRTVHALVEQRARERPHALAVIDGGASVSYAELNRRANRLARHIIARAGDMRGGAAAVMLEPSAELPASLLAVLKTAAAYVPIDPHLPLERVRFMLEDSGATVLVTRSEHHPGFDPAPAVRLNLDTLDAAAVSSANLGLQVNPAESMYLMYTSGSTGKPKACELAHRGIANRLAWMWRALGFSWDDLILQKTPFVFDVSVWELFLPLCFGAAQAVCPREDRASPRRLLDLIDACGVTTAHFVPGMLAVFLSELERGGGRAAALRRIVSSGEELTRDLVRRHHRCLQMPLYNLYGPTEASIDVTWFTTSAEDREVPIGRPIANMRALVLDGELRPAPPDLTAEIYLAGVGLALSYRGRPDLTAAAFVPDPFGDGQRLYRTRDLGGFRTDGNLLFFGRRDSQVKLRGQRIELSEVEAVLRGHPEIENACVRVEGEGDYNRSLTAIVVPAERACSTLARLLQIMRSDAELFELRTTLDNGLTVFSLNRGETEFCYGEIFAREVYRRCGVDISPGDIVVDAGANIGLFSLFAGLRRATVYAFEPIAPLQRLLEANVALYPQVDVRVFRHGLGDREGAADFVYYPHNTILSTRHFDPVEHRALAWQHLEREAGEALRCASSEEIDELVSRRMRHERLSCRLRRLSQVIGEQAIERIDLLKIDVEGSEREVLDGIDASHWGRICQLVVEVNDVNGRLAGVTDLLERHSFAVQVEQDQATRGSRLHQVYAVREALRATVPAPPPEDAAGSAGSPEALGEGLLRLCRAQLPGYMVPAAVIAVDALPTSATGKIDRRALAGLEGLDLCGTRRVVTPRDALESRVARRWCELLGCELVGVTEDFFRIGGDSLRAVELAHRLEADHGVPIDVHEVFANPTVEKLARLIAQGAVRSDRITPIAPREFYDLSRAQYRIWVLSQLEEASAAYNIPGAFVLEGVLDAARVAEALQGVVARHDSLRTVFTAVAGTPRAKVLPAVRVPLDFVDLTAGADPDGTAQRLADAELTRPFDLERGPLVRARLLALSEEKHVLLVTLHHIIADGWSVAVLIREFLAIYEVLGAGRSSMLPLPTFQYQDFAAWQERRFAAGDVQQHREPWMKLLRGAPRLELPLDRPRPAVRSFAGGFTRLPLPQVPHAGLVSLAREEGATRFHALLAAVCVLLFRYTGQTDIVLAVPTAGRERAELADQIGNFVNLLPLRFRFVPGACFRTILREVKEITLAALVRQAYPFDYLVRDLGLSGDISRPPLFDVLVALQDRRFTELPRLDGLSVVPLKRSRVSCKCDLTFNFIERGEVIELELEHDLDLFGSARMAAIAEHFTTLADAVVRQPDVPVAAAPLMKAVEAASLLSWSRPPPLPYSRDRSLGSLFAEVAARYPQRIALVRGEIQVTYAELDRRSSRLARYLLAVHGLRCGEPVGILMERSEKVVTAMLGILKAGGVYMPIDRSYPVQRLQSVLDSAGCRLLLTELGFATGVARIECVDLDEAEGEIARHVSLPLPDRTHATEVAYVMFTSGSTGEPKGVEIPHRGVIRLVTPGSYIDLGDADVVAQSSTFAFDASTFEVWAALLHGGRLIILPTECVLTPAAYAEELRRHGVSVAFLTTSLFNEVARHAPGAFRGVRQVIFGGEAADAGSIARVLERSAPGRLVNGYGPTENTTFTTWYAPIAVDVDAPVPIGRPIGNTAVYLLSGQLALVPAGVPGELYAGGDGLATGYVRRPDLTAERFVPSPFAPGERIYRTGDACVWRHDGNLLFIRRVDDQVKIRGHRVELAEIEGRLRRHPEIADAVVTAPVDPHGHRELIAYYVPANGSPVVAEDGEVHARLASFLKESLPVYMVPARFARLAELPLTANGKVDRNRLPAPAPARPAARRPGAASRTLDRVTFRWCEILGLQPESVPAGTFLACGGHSLKAIQLRARLSEDLGVDVPLRAILLDPTLDELTRAVDLARASKYELLAPTPSAEHYPLSCAQRQLWILSHFGGGSIAYNVAGAFIVEGDLDAEALAAAFSRLIERHESLRTRFLVVGAKPRQQVLSPALCGFQLERGACREGAEVAQLVQAETAAAFDLMRAPPVRARLVRLEDNQHLLVLTIHHILCDGWSMRVLIEELMEGYAACRAGLEPERRPLTLQYRDFVAWQERFLRSPAAEKQKEWWLEQFVDGLPPPALPLDFAPDAEPTFRGGVVSRSLDEKTVAALRRLAKEWHATLFMVLLAGALALLYRISRRTDVLIGAPSAGRNHPELDGQIGLFVNMLALRTRFDPEDTFVELLQKVKATALAAYENQDYPFLELAQILERRAGRSVDQFFDVTIAVYSREDGLPHAPSGLTLRRRPVERATAMFPLSIVAIEGATDLELLLEYSADFFARPTVDLLAGYLVEVLRQSAAAPQIRISAIEL